MVRRRMGMEQERERSKGPKRSFDDHRVAG
jgi:hypothetical protein